MRDMNDGAKWIALPARALIAIEIVLDIAWHSGGTLVPSAEITERTAIPRRSLEPILQELTRAQILAGVRGPHGGYRLARERRNITIGMILAAVRTESKPISSAGEAESSAVSRSALHRHVIMPIWEEISQKIWRDLAPLTIEQLCERTTQVKIPSAGRTRPDFDI